MTPNEYRSRQRTQLTDDELRSAIDWERIRINYWSNMVGCLDRVASCEALLNFYTDKLYGPR